MSNLKIKHTNKAVQKAIDHILLECKPFNNTDGKNYYDIYDIISMIEIIQEEKNNE